MLLTPAWPRAARLPRGWPSYSAHPHVPARLSSQGNGRRGSCEGAVNSSRSLSPPKPFSAPTPALPPVLAEDKVPLVSQAFSCPLHSIAPSFSKVLLCSLFSYSSNSFSSTNKHSPASPTWGKASSSLPVDTGRRLPFPPLRTKATELVPTDSSAPEGGSPPPPLHSEALDRGRWGCPSCLCLKVLLPNSTTWSSWPVSPPRSRTTPSQGFHGAFPSVSSDSCPFLTPTVYFRFPFTAMASTPTWRVTHLISSLRRVPEPSCHSADWGSTYTAPHARSLADSIKALPVTQSICRLSVGGTRPQGFRHHDYRLYSPVLVHQPSDFQTYLPTCLLTISTKLRSRHLRLNTAQQDAWSLAAPLPVPQLGTVPPCGPWSS